MYHAHNVASLKDRPCFRSVNFTRHSNLKSQLPIAITRETS
jgi:hypothetical protein